MELAVWQLKVFCTKYSFTHSHPAACLLIATAKSNSLTCMCVGTPGFSFSQDTVTYVCLTTNTIMFYCTP